VTEDDWEASLEDENILYYPDEEAVLAIAKAWGVDTSFGGEQFEKSTGYVCRFD